MRATAYFLLLVFCFAVKFSFSQLQVTPNNNAAQLAGTLAGNGVTISNATMNCPSLATPAYNPSGTFVGTSSNIGITQGVLLTSGDVKYAVGPNSSSSISADNMVTFSDPDLIKIDPNAIYDVCILEFDAKPTCNVLKFTFAFGSDEYPEFVNSSYNDAFGIFVTGPNPSGPAYSGYNMALIPSTTTPVAINNVNNGNTFSCPTTGPCTNCAYYVDNCATGPPTTVEYDGFTKPITVSLNVTPCSSYHFKLGVADAGDNIYDSGVFFAMQSLICATSLTVTATSTNSNCSGNTGTATVTNVAGGQAPYTYQWSTSPPQNTQTATGLSAGTYTVTVVDANGCLNGTQTVTITAPGGFSVTPTQTNVKCNGASTGSATVTANGGTPPYTYSWNPTGGNASTANNLAAGNYSCTVTDAAGCSQTLAFTITQPTAITVTTVSTASASCGNNNGAATVNASGGTGTLSYSWNNSQTGPSISNVSGGNYMVTVTDANGCTATHTVNIPGGANFTITPTQTNVKCNGASTGSASVSVTGGTTPYTYAWNPSGGNTSSANNLAAGNYTVIITDASGCAQTQIFTLTQPTLLTVSITASHNVSCFGGKDGSASASASGGTGVINYSWNSNPTQAGPNTSNLIAGNYMVTATDANGCTATANVTLTQPAGMTLSGSSTPSPCGTKIGTATVNASGGANPYTYLWLMNPVQTSPTATGLTGGTTYTCIVTDANGCTQEQAVSIGGGSAPTADFSYNPSDIISLLDPIVTFTDGSTGNIASWSWSFGDASISSSQNPIHTYSDTGTYCITLKITDANGLCKDSITKCLRVESPFTFYVPNAFTPNGDGFNEFFVAFGTYIKEFTIILFDRWGNEMWSCHTYGNPQADTKCYWDGKIKSNGKLVQEDVYVWKVNLTDLHDKEYKFTGHVSLVK